MTTENVTVLFTDMVGSTALASTLAPDVADELRREHFAILRQAVAEAGGTEVKNLGDGLMVVFGAASAALSCAVAMQQGVDRDNRGRERPVGLRVGLSGGEVSREDDDYFGDPVVEAARLCARCESGQVLAADIVRLTAGRRSRHECRSLGELTLKGLPDPVETVEVRVGTARPGRRRARCPAAGASGRGVPQRGWWAGRPRWRRCWMRSSVSPRAKAARCSSSRVRPVSARPRWSRRRPGPRSTAGRVCCSGTAKRTSRRRISCSPRRSATSSPTPARSSSSRTSTRMVRSWPGWSRRLSRRLPGLPPSTATDADTERYLLFAAVVGLLVMASEQQPVVVVLDDLQWADKASLQLLAPRDRGRPADAVAGARHLSRQ